MIGRTSQIDPWANSAPGVLPTPKADAIGRMLNYRAELALRIGRQATDAADAWQQLPKRFKVLALQIAGMDTKRECMPLDTLESQERRRLLEAADTLEKVAVQLRRAMREVRR